MFQNIFKKNMDPRGMTVWYAQIVSFERGNKLYFITGNTVDAANKTHFGTSTK